MKGLGVSGVFLTYKFEPGFFEQEVLPVLFDVSLSHAAAIRLVQLEDSLRGIGGEIAVYYDAKGLIAVCREPRAIARPRSSPEPDKEISTIRLFR